MSECIDCGKYIRGHGKTVKRCRRCYEASRPESWISRGYRYIHINGKDIREHRYIMEKHLNRKLLSTESVHHINGDKLDNRIDNLIIMSNSKHMVIHHIGIKRKPHSDETKRKMSEKRKLAWLTRPRVTSNETKIKQSESLKRYWANKHKVTSPS